MVEITLIVWTVTVLGGVALAALWASAGGPGQPQDEGEVAERREGAGRGARAGTRTTEPAAAPGVTLHRIVPHAAVAVAGLILWIGYTVRRDEPGMNLVPLLALLILLVVVGFGLAMFRHWLGVRRLDHPSREAASRLPPLLVAFHGVGAASTLVLVVVVFSMETWPVLEAPFTGVRTPEVEVLGWMVGWAAIGVAAGGALHLAFGRRRAAASIGTTLLLTGAAAMLGGAFGYFLLRLALTATLVPALAGALLASWGRSFGYSVPGRSGP